LIHLVKYNYHPVKTSLDIFQLKIKKIKTTLTELDPVSDLIDMKFALNMVGSSCAQHGNFRDKSLQLKYYLVKICFFKLFF